MQLVAARIAQGVPYCWGSRDPDVTLAAQGKPSDARCPTGSGLDCSGMVIWGYREAGITVPDQTAQGLYDSLPHVSCTIGDLRSATGDGAANGTCWAVGDLVFLAPGGSSTAIYHVAAYAGGGLWNDCYNTSTGCQTWRIDTNSVYSSDFVGAARPSLAWGGGDCGDGGSVAGGGSGGGGVTGPGNTAPTGDQIGGLLAPFYGKEPIGTMLEVGQYVADLREIYREPDTSRALASGPGGAGVSGPLGPLYAGVSVESVAVAFDGHVNRAADMLDAYSIGGVTGLSLIRLLLYMAMIFLLLKMVLNAVQTE
jgi:hypothetical protein